MFLEKSLFNFFVHSWIGLLLLLSFGSSPCIMDSILKRYMICNFSLSIVYVFICKVSDFPWSPIVYFLFHCLCLWCYLQELIPHPMQAIWLPIIAATSLLGQGGADLIFLCIKSIKPVHSYNLGVLHFSLSVLTSHHYYIVFNMTSIKIFLEWRIFRVFLLL